MNNPMAILTQTYHLSRKRVSLMARQEQIPIEQFPDCYLNKEQKSWLKLSSLHGDAH
jgi:hypothetical protein